MQGYNVVMVFSSDAQKLLMCKRRKEPYLGLFNLVGGKIDSEEAGFTAAYRELFEETGIRHLDIELKHMMDFVYHLGNCYVEVYVGRLRRQTTLVEEIHELFWMDLDEDFFSLEKFAGEGNIGHMMEIVKVYKKELIEKDADQ